MVATSPEFLCTVLVTQGTSVEFNMMNSASLSSSSRKLVYVLASWLPLSDIIGVNDI